MMPKPVETGERGRCRHTSPGWLLISENGIPVYLEFNTLMPGNNPMANLIEIRNGTVVNNDDPNDTYLPIDTPIARPDGHYVAIGMDVEGPFGHDEARGRLDHLKKATRMELEDEDRRKQEN
jgi:hypothetical protein